ncbi:MAG: hypothetical protein ABI036_04965 [Fibrobacteria bacterium]
MGTPASKCNIGILGALSRLEYFMGEEAIPSWMGRPTHRPAEAMSTYVINNRIPRFPLKPHYPDRTELQKRLENVFQVWLKERFISNLVRRKTCSQLYDFSVWMADGKGQVESSRAGDFLAWCSSQGFRPQSDWGDFLIYARRRLPELEWDE